MVILRSLFRPVHCSTSTRLPLRPRQSVLRCQCWFPFPRPIQTPPPPLADKRWPVPPPPPHRRHRRHRHRWTQCTIVTPTTTIGAAVGVAVTAVPTSHTWPHPLHMTGQREHPRPPMDLCRQWTCNVKTDAVQSNKWTRNAPRKVAMNDSGAVKRRSGGVSATVRVRCRWWFVRWI